MSHAALKFDIAESDAMPEEVKLIVAGLIEGTIKSLVIIAEMQDGDFSDGYYVDMNDGKSHRMAILGAMETLKRDFMREEIESRREYVGLDDIIPPAGDEPELG